jgi:hypothetical protein
MTTAPDIDSAQRAEKQGSLVEFLRQSPFLGVEEVNLERTPEIPSQFRDFDWDS